MSTNVVSISIRNQYYHVDDILYYMGTLSIVSTPIGNLEDMTLRALRILQEVDLIACEDTRQTAKLLQLLKLPVKPFIRYDDQKEQAATAEILSLLISGKSVALVSDAGTPLLSDPGYVLVREARKRDIPVFSVPGASALLAALTSSGLPTDKFLFLGYPPEKSSHRLALFRSLASINRLIGVTYVLYCAPHKLHTTLTDLKETLGDIDITVCRELTKIHEEIWNGIISEALQKCIHVKGEIVLLIHS